MADVEAAEFGFAELTSVPSVDVADMGALWGLYWAIYYGGADVVKALPRSVQDAYGRVGGVLRG